MKRETLESIGKHLGNKTFQNLNIYIFFTKKEDGISNNMKISLILEEKFRRGNSVGEILSLYDSSITCCENCELKPTENRLM